MYWCFACCLWRLEEGVGSPGTGFTGGCELACGSWESSLGPWEKSQGSNPKRLQPQGCVFSCTTSSQPSSASSSIRMLQTGLALTETERSRPVENPGEGLPSHRYLPKQSRCSFRNHILLSSAMFGVRTWILPSWTGDSIQCVLSTQFFTEGDPWMMPCSP